MEDLPLSIKIETVKDAWSLVSIKFCMWDKCLRKEWIEYIHNDKSYEEKYIESLINEISQSLEWEDCWDKYIIKNSPSDNKTAKWFYDKASTPSECNYDPYSYDPYSYDWLPSDVIRM